MATVSVSIKQLRSRGIEVLPQSGQLSRSVTLPTQTRIEAPASLKKTQFHHSLDLGAFSYQVSGYCFAAHIGRYCSFGEDVQIGRQNHPMHFISTSPAFYVHEPLFGVGENFAHASAYKAHIPSPPSPPTKAKVTQIGHDVWIGHGAYIAAGVHIGTGSVVAAHSVVTKNVAPYSVVAGNPAVVKRWRINPNLVSLMLRSAWWRYAPWQLKHLDISDPEGFAEGVSKMDPSTAFTPDIFDVKDMAS